MARPPKTGLNYFPHDVDVTTDPKIEPAILKYGALAYAFYFMHLEYCYRSDDLCIDISDTEIGTEMREVIQRKLQTDAETYEKILKTFLRHGAFDAKHYASTGNLTSSGIKKRAGNILKKRKAGKEIVREKSEDFNVSASDGQDMPAEPPSFCIVSGRVSAAKTLPEMRKEKESKVKEKGQGQGQDLLVKSGDLTGGDPENDLHSEDSTGESLTVKMAAGTRESVSRSTTPDVPTGESLTVKMAAGTRESVSRSTTPEDKLSRKPRNKKSRSGTVWGRFGLTGRPGGWNDDLEE